MLRTFFNNTLAQSPIKEVESLEEELLLSDQSLGYVYQVQGSITITGDDFDTFRALHASNYCQDVTVDIQHSTDFGGLWESKIKGIIKLVDVEWDLIKREASCPIIDNSYLSRINNNKSIKFTLGNNDGILLSKNGVDVSDRYVVSAPVNLHSPIRGRYFMDEANFTLSNNEVIDMRPINRTGLLIYDALNLLVGMMSDGEVDFASDFFSYNYGNPTDYNEEAWGVLFSGLQLRNNVGFPNISFDDLFRDLHKLFNVYFSLETSSSGRPVMRIENEGYFRSSNSNVYFDSVETMVERINSEMIYGRVIMGCSISSSGDFPIGEIPFLNHIQEEYGFNGNCNYDNTLDLRLNKLIISTNTISKVLPPISGFNNGGSVIRKFSIGNTTSGPPIMNDATGDFETHNVERGFLIQNTANGEWTYITGLTNALVQMQDEVFVIDSTGLAKDYEIYKPSADDSLDKETFLIQIDRANIAADFYFGFISSKQSVIGPFTGNDYDLYYYNDLYSNTNVLARHMDDIGQNLINTGTDGQDEFAAELTTNAAPSTDSVFVPTELEMYRRIAFDDDFTGPTWFDTNGNYNVLTGEYTAPQSGYYHFEASIEWNNDSGFDWTQQMEIARFSQDGQFIDTFADFTTILDGTTFTFTFDKIYYLDEGDTVGIYAKRPFGVNAPYTNQYIDFEDFFCPSGICGYGLLGSGDTWFKCLELVNTADIPETTNTPRIIKIESDLSVSREVFDSVLQNPFKYYHVKGLPNYVSGYIKRLSRNIIDGKATIEIFKKQNGV